MDPGEKAHGTDAHGLICYTGKNIIRGVTVNKKNIAVFLLLAFSTFLLSSCGEFGKDKFKISITPITVIDSKCGGGKYTQSFKIKNLSKKKQKILPKCRANSSGIKVSKAPDTAKILKPGRSKRYSCTLEDVADPPDGRQTDSKVTFVVYVDGQKASVEVPVACDEE